MAGMLELSRRLFVKRALAVIAAPAIVPVHALMPLRGVPLSDGRMTLELLERAKVYLLRQTWAEEFDKSTYLLREIIATADGRVISHHFGRIN